MSETYLFMSHPRAVETRRKYRTAAEIEEDLGNTANMMFDPRVMRGVTCGRPVALNAVQAAEAAAKPDMRRPSKKQLVRAGKIRPTQRTVAQIHETIKVEKKRVEVPLHLYLVEQEEEVQSVNVSSQTDAFLEEPPSPKYIPRKTGVDVGAQVDTDEIFNYDRDVSPILEVVISKTVEQSLMEVRQEEELKSIARNKRFFQKKSQQRGMETTKLEQAEREACENKRKLKAIEMERAERERQVQLKLASHLFSARYMRDAQRDALAELDEDRYFTDPITLAVREFMPWLTSMVCYKTEKLGAAREAVDGLLHSVLSKNERLNQEAERVRDERRAKEAEEARKREEEAAEQARRSRTVQLYIHTDVVPESPVGPISLRADSTVKDVEGKIVEWLEENADEQPEAGKLRFLWNGQTLDASNVLYDIGIESLSTITMEVI
jgi:hypothetical protein